MKKIAIFVSGSGTNCENIIRYFADSEVINVALVVSNRTDAGALDRAKRLNTPSIVINKKQFSDEKYVLSTLNQFGIDVVVLAGFLLMIPDYLIKAFEGRIINLHPALLPKFGGKGMYGHYVHEAVKQAGESETGMTVHHVSSVCDGGEIIAQYRCKLLPNDTVEDISRKEHELEMQYFPKVIEQFILTID